MVALGFETQLSAADLTIEQGAVYVFGADGLDKHSYGPSAVMAGLVPAIHAPCFRRRRTWMPGARPGMTNGEI
jgi:hypothetical protein